MPVSPPGRAQLRTEAEDFQVVELPAFEASGAGEHLLLRVRKRGVNTEWLAGQIARWAGVSRGAVGYAGRKDRHALAEQWFSVHLPGRPSPDLESFGVTGAELLGACRHHRKLQRGALRGNAFCITLHQIEGEPAAITAALQRLGAQGFANYYGSQRFGAGARNLLDWTAAPERRRASRDRRGLMLSAARSLLFNQVLAARVSDGSWDRVLPGDVLALDGTQRWFTSPDPADQALLARAAALDVHPTGPLWGRGEPPSSGPVRALEQSVLAGFELLRAPLEAAGLRQERRPLRAPARQLCWHWVGPRSLRISFQLPRGSFATSALESVFALHEPARLSEGDGT